MKVTSCSILILIHWTVSISSKTFKEVVQETMCDIRGGSKRDCLQTMQGIRYRNETANANATFLCRAPKTISLIHNSAIFIVEYHWENQTVESPWKGARKVNRTTTWFAGLTSVGTYKFRYHRVFKDGISHPEITAPIYFAPYTDFAGGDKAKNISLESLTIQSNDPRRMKLVISFVSSGFCPCAYVVMLSTDTTSESEYSLESLPGKLESVFSGLEFDKNYTISIESFSEDRVSMNFSTPTCSKAHNNLTICAPDKVQGVHGESIHKPGNTSDVYVIWDKPDLLPDFYVVELNQNLEHTMKPLIHNVCGTATQTLFRNVTTLDEYHVVIVAYSSGGKGSPFVAKLNITEETYLQETSSLPNIGSIAIISMSSFGLVLGSSTFAYCWHRKRKLRQMKQAEDSVTLDQPTEDIVELGSIAVRVEALPSPVDEYEIEADRLEIKQFLGKGAFGIVKLGSLRNDRGLITTVAVKMLPDNPTDAERREFKREIKMMKLIRQHRNIVSIVGCCTIGPEPLLIVEYCSQGDLQSFLRAILEKVSTDWVFGKDKRCVSKGTSSDDNSRIPNSTANLTYDDVGPRESDTVTMIDLLNFGHQVARGMEFLSSNRVVHRDLAARNVLVCDNMAVKISDFGLSRDIYMENNYMKRGNGLLPIKWMAIEALTHQMYDTSSDVWSFGILLWEIITLGSTPYPTISPADLLERLQLGYRMKRPENCSLSLYNLMLACWQAKPQNRPTFTTLREELDKLIRIATTGNDYLEFEVGSKEKLAEKEDLCL